MYKEVIDLSTGAKLPVIQRESDGAYIPFDERNADYQQYLIDTDGGLPLPKENA